MSNSRLEAFDPAHVFDIPPVLGGGQRAEKIQGHWLLARAGKRVLRPGGLELTRQMVDALAIGPLDHVVEFAPGLGVTARMVLRRKPCTYCGVEREPAAVELLRKRLGSSGANIVLASAERSGLPDSTATVLYGEALLTMQTQEQKDRIIGEACRLLVYGGRYAIHEICLLPDEVTDPVRREIQAAMAKEIHVGVQLLTRREWIEMFEQHGLAITWSCQSPMHLLEPRRVLRDEGFARALRFAWRVARTPVLRHRVLAMKRLFRRYEEHLGSISLVGRRLKDGSSC